MLKVSRLRWTICEPIMYAMGYKHGEDPEPYMDKIAALTPIEAMRLYCQWEYGNQDMADKFVHVWGRLQQEAQ